MALTLELTQEQHARLEAAAQHDGVEPSTLALEILVSHLPPDAEAEEPDPTLALFAQWRQEDAQTSAVEQEQERALWGTFEHGINEARREQGMRQF